MNLPFIPKSKTQAGKDASKGKEAEDMVQQVFKELAIRSGFDFERNYDARSSGGHNFARRCGDFTWYMQVDDVRAHGVVEVKELKALGAFPYSRLDQIGKMRRRTLAGGMADVLIRVAPNTADECWLWEGVEWFADNKVDYRASWDLRLLKTYHTLTAIPLMQMFNSMSPASLNRMRR
jgi:hypothetical protein